MEPIHIGDPRWVEIVRSFTSEQKQVLLGLKDEMQGIGATRKQTAPLGAVIWVRFEPLTPEERQEAQEAWKRLEAGEL